MALAALTKLSVCYSCVCNTVAWQAETHRQAIPDRRFPLCFLRAMLRCRSYTFELKTFPLTGGGSVSIAPLKTSNYPTIVHFDPICILERLCDRCRYIARAIAYRVLASIFSRGRLLGEVLGKAGHRSGHTSRVRSGRVGSGQGDLARPVIF